MLCSCSFNNKPAEICVNRIFNAKADIQFNSTAYTADFTCKENGCNAVFSSPDETIGLEVSTDGENFTYSLGDLEFTSTETDYQTQLIGAIYSAIVTLPVSATENEETYILEGVSKYGNYIMYLNKENCTPVFIEYEDKDITVKFKDIA
jgi:hypothetical protein